MNNWTPILGENLSTPPESKSEIDKYTMAVTTDARVIGHWKKWKTGRYAKTVSYFLRANPMNAARITDTGKTVNFGNEQDMQIPCIILFKREEIYIEALKKTVKPVPFIIICTLEILSVKCEEY